MSNELTAKEQESSAMISMIERAAMNPDVDMDKMERLLEMQERIIKRNSEMAFNAALAEMQSEMPLITKDAEIKVSGQVRSKYASFENINETVKPILQKYGFAVSFRTETSDSIKVTGILVHKDGHREQTDMVLPVDASGSKNAVQAIGSSVAYGKRYVLCALLNISTGDDDDARGTVAKLSDEQIANIESLIEEVGADRRRFIQYISGGMWTSLEDTPASKYKKAIADLEAKRKANFKDEAND